MRLTMPLPILYVVLLAGIFIGNATCSASAQNLSDIYTTRGFYADLSGVKLWYVDTGGSGTPVVLLHANTGTSANWQGQYDAFAQAGYRVIAFDRRGWGKSIPQQGAEPSTMADDLSHLMIHLNIDKFHLIGVAGGGINALDYSAWKPDTLRSLVVAASTARIVEPPISEYIKRIELRGVPAAIKEVGASYRATNPDGFTRWKDIEEHSRQKGVKDQPLRSPNTLAKIASISTPMLIINADADLSAPQSLMRAWADKVQNYEWAVIEDAGHSVNWEKPGEFNQAVLAFLAKH